jgi:hypothetical protein
MAEGLQKGGSEITDKCDMILYCLVMSTHTIPMGEITFWDWEDDLVKAWNHIW